jgi:MoaA/NifB/PqqE/SkfB family radical SAM enzyme
MEKIGIANAIRLTMRGCYNFVAKKPLVVSFEVTSSCNADCLHCDKGGIIEGEKRPSPAEIARFYRELRPVAVQLSGGEPLLRDDIIDIAREIKEPSGAPYIILVTNGFLLEKDIYLRLRDAGVNQFSISLDFPDERHDVFRNLPGLYRHLEKTVPELTAMGNEDIILNTAISKENLDVLTGLCRKATEWGSSMSYSAYSPLRTGNRDYLISEADDMEKLRKTIDELIGMKGKGYRIRNPVSILENTYRYFRDGGIGGCKAGYRFLLITPEGYHRPCAHKRVKFHSQEELIEGFARTNECRGCYVAIRSYCDKSFLSLVREQVISRIIPQT